MYDVITVGSATVDCFAILKQDFTKIKHGEKILIKDIEFHTGGGATNVGVGLARLGIKTGFLGELGKDHPAQQIVDHLKNEGVSIVCKERSRHPTSYSIILDTKKTDRAILAFKGASNYLHYNEFSKNKLKTRWFYFASMVGSSFKTLKLLADFALRHDINVYFNPSSYMAKKGRRYLSRILKATKIICMNKEEAQYLLGTKSRKMDALLEKLFNLKKNIRIALITDGKKGVHAFDGEKKYSIKPHEVKLVDTTGAGDAFGAGFLAGYIMKGDIDFALNLGLVNSEAVIGKVGAKKGLLKKRPAFKRLREHNVIK